MFVWSLFSIIGVWIIHRTFDEFESLKVFSKKQFDFLNFLIYFLIILINFLLKKNFLILFLINILIFLAPFFIPIFIQKIRISRVKKEIIPCLDTIIMSMRSGKSFRQSIIDASGSSHIYMKLMLDEFLSSISFQKKPKTWSLDSEVNNFFGEIWTIERSTYRQVEMLLSFRRKISLINDFRQRSRQAMLQTRAQSMISAFIYGLVLIFVHFKFGLNRYPMMTFVSVLIFSAGFITTLKMGRSYKWKI